MIATSSLSDEQPVTAQLTLQSLPLFPLETVLFPGGVLALRIFEVRYLDMIGKCHQAGAPFGVVNLQRGSEVRKPFAPTETFHPEGTLATIRRLDVVQPGLMLVHCQGLQRFRITRSECLPRGLWIADVERLSDDPHIDIPEDLSEASVALQRLVQSLRSQLPDGATLPVAEPFQFGDCGWVANRWCELLPLPLPLKQRLMTLDSPLVRLELVSDVLDRTGIGKS